jgi:hypothetical protein
VQTRSEGGDGNIEGTKGAIAARSLPLGQGITFWL